MSSTKAIDPGFDDLYREFGASLEQPPRPVNWNLLTSEEADLEWRDLDAWVTWLKSTFGLPPSIVPPNWHRHDELIWELSALHTHFLSSYDPDTSPSAPIGWMRDFADTRHRLREWVAICGTRLDRDRPTRQTTWPGEEPPGASNEVVISDRATDFEEFVRADVRQRQRIEHRVARETSRSQP